MLQVRVFATYRFEGFHRWPDAPESCGYLADLHRHEFHVRVEVLVPHYDRAVEFIQLKRRLVEAVDAVLKVYRKSDTWSCEQWGHYLLRELSASKVEVSEDGENGSVVELVG